MPATHTVLYQFGSDASAAHIKRACDHVLGLKDECVHPTTKEPYILSIQGGKDNFPEGMQKGLTHGFVVTFSSIEDRDYYVKEDPAHQLFITLVVGLVEKVIVLDFENGVF